MQFRDIIPFARRYENTPALEPANDSPVAQLQRDMNRVFDEFWNRFGVTLPAQTGAAGFGVPRLDISESDDKVEVVADLPGLTEKDVELGVTDDTLTIRGEKKDERTEEKKGYYLSERSYGAFHRAVPLPPGVDADKAEARFANGVLTVTLPKADDARSRVRRIEVKAA